VQFGEFKSDRDKGQRMMKAFVLLSWLLIKNVYCWEGNLQDLFCNSETDSNDGHLKKKQADQLIFIMIRYISAVEFPPFYKQIILIIAVL
jgi:hypothetical protein